MSLIAMNRCFVVSLLCGLTWNVAAQTAVTPILGSDYLVQADPVVPSPADTPYPCTASIEFDAQTGAGSFAGYSPRYCGPGPWAKIVLQSVAVATYFNPQNIPPMPFTIWLNGVNVYYGNITPGIDGAAANGDPYAVVPIGKDLTDYAYVLAGYYAPPFNGGSPFQYALRGNWSVGLGNESPNWGSNSGLLYVNAIVAFYPPTAKNPAPIVPDLVYPLGASAYWQYPVGASGYQNTTGIYTSGALANLRTPADQLTVTLNAPNNPNLPGNIERAYLDVTLRPTPYTYVPSSSGNGQFTAAAPWYSCLPELYAQTYPSLVLDANHAFAGHCIGGSFREAEISIDDQPAGVVPLYPAYPIQSTSDAQTWLPSMQPQEVNYLPYRADLSPFAALLSNGAQHTIAVSIASNSDAATTSNPVAGVWGTANLLVYLDHGVKQVTGAITQNDLLGHPPLPLVSSTLAKDSQGKLSGNVITSSQRHYVIDGYVNGSKGRLRSRVERTVNFDNSQYFSLPPTATPQQLAYQKDISLQSSDYGDTRTYLNGPLVGVSIVNHGYPLTSSYYLNRDPSVEHQIKQIRQDVGQQLLRSQRGATVYSATTQNLTGGTIDTLTGLTPGQGYNLITAQSSWQTFKFNDSLGSCYNTALTVQTGQLASWATGAGCPQQKNTLQWQSHPDGSPDSLGWVSYP